MCSSLLHVHVGGRHKVDRTIQFACALINQDFRGKFTEILVATCKNGSYLGKTLAYEMA